MKKLQVMEQVFNICWQWYKDGSDENATNILTKKLAKILVNYHANKKGE